jgi:hypothetical protein
MSENQKLREALQLIAWSNDSKWQVDCARQALALPTADHLPDAGKMVNGLTKAETDASASVSGLTAAPVGEREAFERTMMDKYGWQRNDFKLDDFGYFDGHTDTAWMAWQARAAMSAGDAVDAQQSTPIACAVHVAGRTFEKGVPFCDVIDYIESNTTRWVASSDRHPPEGERVFFMDLATNIVGFDMWAGEGFTWMPSHWMPIPPAPAMRKDKP